MKHFLFALFILSTLGCDHKVTRSTPFRAEEDKRSTDSSVLTKVQQEYSSRAEGVYGLLWPTEMHKTEPAKLALIMTRARDLQATRKSYTIENQRISNLNREFKCNCATAGICEQNEDPLSFPPETVEKCTALEEEKFANDQKLSVLLEQQAQLKDAVLVSGGDWLENDPIDLRIDLPNMKFELSAFRFINQEKVITSIEAPQIESSGPYNENENRIIRRANSVHWAAGQNISGGSMTWQLDGLELPGALQFQGKIEIEINGVKRQGQIGFQLPQK